MQILTMETWGEFVSSPNLTVILYGFDGCKPCVKFKPEFEKFFVEGTIEVGFFELPKNAHIPKINVKTVPMVVFYRNGQEICRIVGGSIHRLEGTLKGLLK